MTVFFGCWRIMCGRSRFQSPMGLFQGMRVGITFYGEFSEGR